MHREIVDKSPFFIILRGEANIGLRVDWESVVYKVFFESGKFFMVGDLILLSSFLNPTFS